MAVTGLSRTTIWRRVRDHEFPTPLRLGGLKTQDPSRRLA